MNFDSIEIDSKVRKAIQKFWLTRASQAQRQGSSTGVRDAGARVAVTGGAQMDGFSDIIKQSLHSAGVSEAFIFQNKKLVIPGWYRAEKKWDLLVVADGKFAAGIELKSQVGSFGNNFNNRAEEAIGSATDLWAAYREGAFEPSPRPWLGYLMLLEEAPKSLSAVKVQQPHFKVFPEFIGASYTKRYELLLTKLVRDRLYDSACLLLSSQSGGDRGEYSEPSSELSFYRYLRSLVSHTVAIAVT
ncbi:MAG: restriction endonuclease [Chloroflexota bacterium]|nr:restriction endonuclease [Chloroflexota bacterium]